MPLRNVWNWADIRGKHTGQLAFIAHRLTGLVILLYLFIHLYALSNLLNGGASYQQFLNTVESPPFVALDILLFLVIIYHGANGIRLIFNEFGVGTKRHKIFFWVMMALGVVAWIALSYIVVVHFMGGA